MGATVMRRSICFIGRIFFAIVGPVKHWTDNAPRPTKSHRDHASLSGNGRDESLSGGARPAEASVMASTNLTLPRDLG